MDPSRLRDFEVHVRDGGADGGFPVTMRVPSEDRVARGVLHVPFDRSEIDRALVWMERGLFDAASAKEFGRGLFEAMFEGGLAAFYRASAGVERSRLRLRLVIDAPDVARVPWELLYDPVRGSYLALDAPLVRGLSLLEATRAITVAPPLRILVVDAFPRGTPRLAGHVETASIRGALARLVDHGRVAVTARSHVTLRSLQVALRQAVDRESPEPFHVLHVIAHGDHDERTGTTVLILEDEDGEPDAIDPETLIAVLRPFDVKLVVLNACDSVQPSAFDITHGFAPALLASGVPAVMGMQVSVLDRVATQVTADFYAALADGQSVEMALTDARIHLRGVRHRRKADMAIPVCYLRTATGTLLEHDGTAPVGDRPWYRRAVDHARRAPPWVLVVAGLALVVAVLDLLRPADSVDVSPMGSLLNVAVAPFGERDGRGRIAPSNDGRVFAEVLHGALVDRFAASGEIEVTVLPPSATGMVDGRTADHQARNAEAVARELNAHILVYGSVEVGDYATTVTAVAFLNHQPRDIEEAYGHYEIVEFAVQSDAGRNTFSNDELREHMKEGAASGVHAAAELFLGLSRYERGEHEAARSLLLGALAMKPGLEPTGRALAHVILSYVALLEQDLDAAEEHARAAHAADPEHASPLLSLAQVELRLATDLTGDSACRAASTDLARLRSVIGSYERVLRLDHRPTSSVPLKATLLLGHASLCGSFATRGVESDQLQARAVAAFEHVVALHLRSRFPTSHLAAEAHAGLGVILHRAGRRDEALHAYDQALSKGSRFDHQRRAVWLNAMAGIHLDRAECEAADQRLAAAAAEYVAFRRDHPHLTLPAYEQNHEANAATRNRTCGEGAEAPRVGKEEAG